MRLLSGALANAGPILALVYVESRAWRAELASWRHELAGARITIEPASSRPSTAALTGPTAIG